ncbi:MAG: FAD assembly factor SdhE [Gammaproteobacteria bacterium]
MTTSLHPKRIRWACRRGMLELDVLLLPFFEKSFASLTVTEQAGFVALLSESDQDLYNWLLGKAVPIKPIYIHLVEKIRAINVL